MSERYAKHLISYNKEQKWYRFTVRQIPLKFSFVDAFQTTAESPDKSIFSDLHALKANSCWRGIVWLDFRTMQMKTYQSPGELCTYFAKLQWKPKYVWPLLRVKAKRPLIPLENIKMDTLEGLSTRNRVENWWRYKKLCW